MIKDIQRRQRHTVVHLGDTLSGPLRPLETATLLHQLDWLHAAGNPERQALTLPLDPQNRSDAFTAASIDHHAKACIGQQPTPQTADPMRGACGPTSSV